MRKHTKGIGVQGQCVLCVLGDHHIKGKCYCEDIGGDYEGHSKEQANFTMLCLTSEGWGGRGQGKGRWGESEAGHSYNP
jgi:hypothetical protein